MDSTSIRRLQEEVLDLPGKVYEDRVLELTGRQRDAYAKMRDELVLDWKKLSEEEFQLHYPQVGAQLIRLSQIADGYLSDGETIEWLLDTVKIKELDDILETMIEGEKKKVVVWSHYIAPILHLQERYEERYGSVIVYGAVSAKRRAERVKAFRGDDGCKLYIGQVSTGGVGVDLTPEDGGTGIHDDGIVRESRPWQERVMVFFRVGYVWSEVEQAEGRCARISQVGTLPIIRLLAQDTVDERIIKYLRQHALEAKEFRGDVPKLSKDVLLDMLKK